MIGGLFGIFLRGLVKKNQEIEKIKSISKYLLLPIVFSVLFQPLELIALNAYLSMAQIHPVKTHFTTTTHPTSWRGLAWGAAKAETDFFQPQLVLKYLEPMVSSINRRMPTHTRQFRFQKRAVL